MGKKSKKEKFAENENKEKFAVSERVKEYLIRAHSFQEMGTEQLPDENFDILHFPQILLAAGVIMAIYGYFIIYISTDKSAQFDGLAALIVGNVIATLGILKLLKKYWFSFIILLFISLLIIVGMMALWDFLIVPWAEANDILSTNTASTGSFIERTSLVVLTTTTFAYIACFVWLIGARYTSTFYYKLFSRGKKRENQFFIVDPWRKTLASKGALIKDILGRIYYPFLFLLTIILTLSEIGGVYFIQISLDRYFEAILFMYVLLCAMVIIFPAFWLLDYVRYYNETRLEVRSMGQQVLILVKGYAGFGVIFTFISRSQSGIQGALMEFFMLTLYLIPVLIILIGAYVLLTERDVYYIADKIVHGDTVIVEYKLIDSKGEELKWWLGSKKRKIGGTS
ncbi:MAG: hypothetical protein ACTSPD_05410 [Promethearchaeota archaeon]